MTLEEQNILDAIAIEEFRQKQKKQYYIKNPDKWFTERLGEPITTLKWSEFDKKAYSNHVWDGTPDPFYEVFLSLARGENVAVESSTNIGKTFITPRLIYWFLDCFHNSLIVTTAPSGGQLKRGMWGEIQMSFNKFKKIRPKAQLYDSMALYPLGNTTNATDDDTMKKAYLCYGKTVQVGSDSKSAVGFQGAHRKNMLHIVDEAPGVSPAVSKAIQETSTGDFNPIVYFGNPDNINDPLHLFAEKKTTRLIRISSLDHPNVVLGRNIIPAAVSIGSIQIRKEDYGEDSDFYKSRVRGISPQQSSDSLIKMIWIEQCSTLMSKDAKDIPYDGKSNNAIGIDVANSENGDEAALGWGKKNILMRLEAFACSNANDLAYNLVKDDIYLRKNNHEIYGLSKLTDWKIGHKNVGVDTVGIGKGTLNVFTLLGLKVVSLEGGYDKLQVPLDKEGKPLYSFISMRAQMYYQARLDLQNKDCIIDIKDRRVLDELIRQLITIKYKVTNGNIVVESKADIKKRLGGKSTNEADAFVYWNWVRKDRSGTKMQMPFM